MDFGCQILNTPHLSLSHGFKRIEFALLFSHLLATVPGKVSETSRVLVFIHKRKEKMLLALLIFLTLKGEDVKLNMRNYYYYYYVSYLP